MTTDAQYHPTIKELPKSERPRERLLRCGAGALSNGELLAIILRTGTRDENVVDTSVTRPFSQTMVMWTTDSVDMSVLTWDLPMDFLRPIRDVGSVDNSQTAATCPHCPHP